MSDMTTSGGRAPDVLRIGDAEREHVREILQQHTTEGRLTLDELSDRLGEVYAARTAADLEHPLRQLPPLPEASAARVPAERIERWRSGAWMIVPVVVAILLVVWATTGAGVFWPLWPLFFFAFRVLGGFGAWGRGGTHQPPSASSPSTTSTRSWPDTVGGWNPGMNEPSRRSA